MIQYPLNPKNPKSHVSTSNIRQINIRTYITNKIQLTITDKIQPALQRDTLLLSLSLSQNQSSKLTSTIVAGKDARVFVTLQ